MPYDVVMKQSMRTASCDGAGKPQQVAPCQRHGVLIVCAIRQQGHAVRS